MLKRLVLLMFIFSASLFAAEGEVKKVKEEEGKFKGLLAVLNSASLSTKIEQETVVNIPGIIGYDYKKLQIEPDLSFKLGSFKAGVASYINLNGEYISNHDGTEFYLKSPALKIAFDDSTSMSFGLNSILQLPQVNNGEPIEYYIYKNSLKIEAPISIDSQLGDLAIGFSITPRVQFGNSGICGGANSLLLQGSCRRGFVKQNRLSGRVKGKFGIEYGLSNFISEGDKASVKLSTTLYAKADTAFELSYPAEVELGLYYNINDSISLYNESVVYLTGFYIGGFEMGKSFKNEFGVKSKIF